MSRFTRRTFVKAAAASAVFPAFTIAGTKASGRVIGANDTIRVGVAGIHGRGGAHIGEFVKLPNVAVTHLIDPDSSLFASRTKQVTDRGGQAPKCVQDVREALEDKNLDAVSVAAPNHWHSLIGVWACQAGKDAYIEKPISHNVFEGRQVAEAAKKYNRVVQHGTQQRSSSGRAREMAAIQSGKYGKLLVSKGYCCKPRWSIGVKNTGTPPAHLDFDVWLGPAEKQPYHGNLVHYNWHWFWDFGNGDTGNQGVHEMDVARWAIKDATLPNRVWSLGGRFIPGEKDQGETPNMQLSVYEFGDVLLVFETRGLVGKSGAPPANVSNEFYTTEGMIRGGKFYPKGGGSAESVKGEDVQVTDGGAFGSFIAAMRSRKPEDNNCDAEVGHYSSALCHLGNISYRLGESQPFSKKAQSIGDNKQVVEAFGNLRENLQAVNIDLDETTYQLGRTLDFNPKTERFDDDEANALLSRSYREPYVVPEKV
jgi:predicted dehydrogenase